MFIPVLLAIFVAVERMLVIFLWALWAGFR